MLGPIGPPHSLEPLSSPAAVHFSGTEIDTRPPLFYDTQFTDENNEMKRNLLNLQNSSFHERPYGPLFGQHLRSGLNSFASSSHDTRHFPQRCRNEQHNFFDQRCLVFEKHDLSVQQLHQVCTHETTK